MNKDFQVYFHPGLPGVCSTFLQGKIFHCTLILSAKKSYFRDNQAQQMSKQKNI